MELSAQAPPCEDVCSNVVEADSTSRAQTFVSYEVLADDDAAAAEQGELPMMILAIETTGGYTGQGRRSF